MKPRATIVPRTRRPWCGHLAVVAAWMLLAGPSLAQPLKSTQPLGAGERIAVLVVSGSDAFHDWRRTTPQLRAMLEQPGRFDVRVVEDAAALGASDLTARYKVIILNQQTPTSTPALRRNLRRFVERGGGLVALHWAVDNFSDWPGFTDVLGRTWREGQSVEEHGAFKVKVVGAHPITEGLATFTTATAEAVHYRLHGTAPMEVLAVTTSARTGEEVAVLMTRRLGQGRVVFTPFGHSVASRENPGFQRLLLRAVEWAGTGRVAP